MILAKLRGGLSNQMFQYAAARRLAHRHGTGVQIDASYYDTSVPGATPRKYELDVLRPEAEIASHWETIGLDGVRNTPVHELPVALYRKLRPRYRFVAERHFHFDPTVLELPDDVCLFGYWVSEKYFADVAATIREEFRFRAAPSETNTCTLEAMAGCQSVAVHVRRGDYLASHITPLHGLCDVDYYRRAADLVRARVADPVYYVFSDDLDWCREHLGFLGDVVYVDDNRGSASAEDLRLMAGARHNIVANSSFSWWGAWLNGNPEKLVVAPREWMADPSFDTRDVVPDAWLRA